MSTAVKGLNIRTRRGKLINEMGLVSRIEQKRFQIKSPSRGEVTNEVTRNEKGLVVCTCDEFKEQFVTAPYYRCEHILAVKYFLEDGNTSSAQEENHDAS